MGKPLKLGLEELHSARRGDYRVIYRIDHQRRLATIVAVEHRSDIYQPAAGTQEPAPVYLAALGPQMLRLAGEVADGALLNWATPQQIAVSRERIDEGAARAGRGGSADRSRSRICCGLRNSEGLTHDRGQKTRSNRAKCPRSSSGAFGK